MTRFAATVACDLRLQLRNGFYVAVAFVAAVSVAILRLLPAASVAWLLPLVVFQGLVVTSFYFMAGLVLLEKTEGTIAARVVTPLRTAEYLGAKVLTLTALSVAEGVAVVALGAPGRVGAAGLGWLTAGLALMAAFFCLAGFAFVARYDSINEFLLPSVAFTAALGLPLVEWISVWSSPLFYLHPFQAQFALVAAAFEPAPAWRLAYGVAYSTLWLIPAWIAARRAFDRRLLARWGSAAA